MIDVTMLSADASASDLEEDAFLEFLENDIVSHPGRLQAVDAGLVESLFALTGGVCPDLGAPLSLADE